MTHEIAVAELLPFYVNGTLDEADRTRVEAELASCARCAQELRELHHLADVLRTHAIVTAPLSPRVLPAVLDRLTPVQHGFEPIELRRSLPAWWSIPLSYVAALLLVFGGGAIAAGLHLFGDGGSAAASAGGVPHRVTLRGASASGPAAGVRVFVDQTMLRVAVADPRTAQAHARAIVAAAGGTAHDDAGAPAQPFDAIVPSSRARSTLSALGALGRVTTRTTVTRDVTAEIAAQDRAIARERGRVPAAVLRAHTAWRNSLAAAHGMDRVTVRFDPLPPQ